MSKQIRPLVAFKKAYPERYDILTDKDNLGLSKKAQENEFYWMYAFCELNSFSKPLSEYLPHPFFWKDENNKNNKLTITELGRLLLTGWYYNIEDYTKELSQYVLRAHAKKVKEAEEFNDLEIYEVVNHIRENIGYYYHNQIEAKYYLLDKLFNKDLKKLLPPPPEKIKEYERIVSYISEIRKNQKKKGVDYWIDKAEDLESYNIYLQDILEEIVVVNYLSFEDWEKEKKQENKEYFKELNVIREEYKKSILNDIKKLLLE
jgi:hypothetical protein